MHDVSKREDLLHLYICHRNSRKVRPRCLPGTSLEVIENQRNTPILQEDLFRPYEKKTLDKKLFLSEFALRSRQGLRTRTPDTAPFGACGLSAATGEAPPRRAKGFRCRKAVPHALRAPSLRSGDGPPRSSLFASLRAPPKGASRAVRVRYRSPVTAHDALRAGKIRILNPFRRYATSEKWLKPAKTGGGCLGAAI